MPESAAGRCTPETPLRELAWLSPQRLRQLERFGLANVEDLLTHYPRRHEDRSRFDQFPDGESAQPVCVCGLVKKTQLKRLRGSLKMFDAILEQENPHALSAPLVCRWFNAHWVEKAIVAGLAGAGLSLLSTQLHQRQAFQAMFANGSTLDELDPSEVNGIGAAQDNALALAGELIEVLTREPAHV